MFVGETVNFPFYCPEETFSLELNHERFCEKTVQIKARNKPKMTALDLRA